MKTLLTSLTLMALLGCGTKCPEPYYDGSASDEAWRTMQDGEARATVDDSKAVKLFFPLEGAQLSGGGAAVTFKWSSPLTAARERSAPTPMHASTLSRLGELFYSSAWAHLPPVTGAIHWLQLTAPKQTCRMEVLTTRNEWIPNEAAWAQLKTFTAGPVSLDVFSAYLQETRISEGEYHLSKPVGFSIGQ
jgi:hypothetical protein